MTVSFNYAFQKGSLSISLKGGIISLIPQKNKDNTLLENLRLISLLNVDYKILTKWNYLRAALQTFNFGPDILNWFQVIYNQASSCVLHNGHAPDFFLLERGVRQGCPLSGLLFVVGIELLARVLKKDHTIKGINVGQKKIKQISGLEINTNKTEALRLGWWRSRKDKPLGFKWPQEPVYALGIHFSYDLKQANTLNFEEKVCSLEKTLKNIRFAETHIWQFLTDRI